MPLTKAFSFFFRNCPPDLVQNYPPLEEFFNHRLGTDLKHQCFSFSERFLKFSNSAILRRSRSFNSSIFHLFIFFFFLFSFLLLPWNPFSPLISGTVSSPEVIFSSSWISSAFSSAAISSRFVLVVYLLVYLFFFHVLYRLSIYHHSLDLKISSSCCIQFSRVPTTFS